uniref:Uncharacterized protein n=1 Tax=Arundo donax TaxID=35708 RepID=A0A0A9AUG3_ARUDO
MMILPRLDLLRVGSYLFRECLSSSSRSKAFDKN